MGRLTIFTINGAYLNQGVVAVNSYLRHNPDDEVMVFATTATQNALKYKEVFSKYKVAVVLLEPNDTSWFPNSYFCPVEVEGMCLRLKAIDYLAEHRPDVSRLFYLDSDIVVRTSLAGIWNAPLDNAYVAAALDYQRVQELPHLYRKHFDWNRRMQLNRNYFNSGVMMLNLDLIRQDFPQGIANGFIESYDGRWILPDQDYLNKILSRKPTVILPRVFNWMPELLVAEAMSAVTLLQDRVAAYHTARVMHFAGKLKPWVAFTGAIPREVFAHIRYDMYYRACKEAVEEVGCIDTRFLYACRDNHDSYAFIGRIVGDLLE